MTEAKPALAPKSGIRWSPVLAVVFVVATYYVSQFFGVIMLTLYAGLRGWSNSEANSWLQQSIVAQFSYILIVEALTVLALYGFLRWQKTGWRTIGWRRPQWRDLGWGLLLVIPYYVTYLILAKVVQTLVPALNVNQQQQIGFDNATSAVSLILTFISLVVLPPLVEELLVRGFLYTSLRDKLPKIGAALTTSIIFATAHLQFGSGAPLLWIAFIDTFILSLFLIYLRERTNGLWAGITLHATKNLLAFATIFLLHMR